MKPGPPDPKFSGLSVLSGGESLENIISIFASEIESGTWAHAGWVCQSVGNREQLRTLAKVGATSGCARRGYMPPAPAAAGGLRRVWRAVRLECSAERSLVLPVRLGRVAGYGFPAGEEAGRVLGSLR